MRRQKRLMSLILFKQKQFTESPSAGGKRQAEKKKQEGRLRFLMVSILKNERQSLEEKKGDTSWGKREKR
jgi:hypothetical protein